MRGETCNNFNISTSSIECAKKQRRPVSRLLEQEETCGTVTIQDGDINMGQTKSLRVFARFQTKAEELLIRILGGNRL
jgi:hypothetical protein